MKELHRIVKTLSEKEKKAARRYFTQKYANTKELQLFKVLETSCSEEGELSPESIRELGYESAACRSFQKLKVRLRNKLFDFLTSNSAISECKDVDANAFLQQRLKKANLQACILREKSHLNHSSEMLKNSIRLAEKNGQYSSMVEAMNELQKIHEIKAEYDRKNKITFKMKHYKKVSDKIEEMTELFKEVIRMLENEYMNFSTQRLRETKLIIQANSDELKNEELQFMSDHLQALDDLASARPDESLEIFMKWNKRIKANPARFNLEFKALNQQLLLQRSFLSVRSMAVDKSAKQNNAIDNFSMPFIRINLAELAQRIRIADMREAHDLMTSIDQNLTQEVQQNNSITYQRAFLRFISSDYKTCMRIVNDHIRKFSSTSLQQVDFMILEIMSLFELEKLDLLEYKIQGFGKNLAYRKKFDLPEHYCRINLLLTALLRSNYNFKDEKVLRNWKLLSQETINPLLEMQSHQPKTFCRWFSGHAQINLPIKGAISMEALAAAIF
ncbi:MAG: hypothetical protein RIC15_07565 [Vicingaceae bacterium]